MTRHGGHRVVVVGGGFGGLFAARRLGRAGVDVTLVDRSANHVFQPMLYQCATGVVPIVTIAPPLRAIFRRHSTVRVLLADVVGFDLDGRTVRARSPAGADLSLPYDSLIVAAGVHTSYFGRDEFAQHAPGLKTIEDAVRVGGRIFGAFEAAEACDDPDERRGWLTFAVVGAGPTGVELAGQIRQAATHTLRREYRRIDPSTARVLLFDGGAKPLATFGSHLSERAARTLASMGVELHMGCLATAVDGRGLDVRSSDGSVTRHEARTILWTAGVAASPLGRVLAEAAGASTDRAGRVEVLPDCTVPGRPEVFVIGDLMSLDHLPGVAEVAMQSGLHAARTIRRRLAGRPTKPFHYVDMGSMAYVGRRHAVVEFRGLRLSGFLGWLMWLAVHLTFLTGFMNRVGAMLNWSAALTGARRFRILDASAVAGGRYEVATSPAATGSDASRGAAAGAGASRADAT
ncbi:MAG TPA: NAD(P)/FAD-dependent oxidoreductase [Candidatus Dormibacteraeota bacterium]|nr:NAD(P)/FAD-dependent oxidoreductase [Candidatus Dormibacteraeota bacterium]